MKRTGEAARAWQQQAGAWIVDYAAAREQAIKWLGDRYLLAKPINRVQRAGLDAGLVAPPRTVPTT